MCKEGWIVVINVQQYHAFLSGEDMYPQGAIEYNVYPFRLRTWSL